MKIMPPREFFCTRGKGGVRQVLGTNGRELSEPHRWLLATVGGELSIKIQKRWSNVDFFLCGHGKKIH